MTREAIDTMFRVSSRRISVRASVERGDGFVLGRRIPNSEVLDRMAITSDLPKLSLSTVIPR